MKQVTSAVLAMLLATAAGPPGVGAASAQPPKHPDAAQGSQGAPQPGATEDADEEVETFPVMAVTSVEIMRSKTAPTTDVVVVNGLTSADGWNNGELVPLRHGTSSDGVLDLVFVAEAPKESASPGGYVPIQAIIPLEAGHPYKAVRVRGATNSLLAKELPGHVEAKQPVEACKACNGKVFVAKGATSPAGTGSDDVVREDKLPANTRVVHQADGLADTQHDPNRLTIIIGEDGRIADAAWE